MRIMSCAMLKSKSNRGIVLYVYDNQELLTVIDLIPLLDNWHKGAKDLSALQQMIKAMQDEIYRTIDNVKV